jgi:hypothetical protein
MFTKAISILFNHLLYFIVTFSFCGIFTVLTTAMKRPAKQHAIFDYQRLMILRKAFDKLRKSFLNYHVFSLREFLVRAN